MDLFLSQINVNDNQLKSYIVKRISIELNNLTVPCYYPSLKKDYYEILRLSGVNEHDLKAFVKRYYKGTPGEKWAVTTNPIVNLYIFLARYFLVKNDLYGYTIMINFIVLYWYQNLIRKHIPYCNSDAFRYALENIPKIHLFSREKSIPSALLFLSKELAKNYQKRLGEYSFEVVSNFIQISRSRVAQSIRSFQAAYFKAIELGIKYKSEEESSDDEEKYRRPPRGEELGLKFADEMVQRICVFKTIDRNAIMTAKKYTNMNIKFGENIIKNISNLKYNDNIRIITLLFLKKIKNENINELCKNYIVLVKKLMTLKRFSEPIYFKQQIGVLTSSALEELGKAELINNRKFLNITLFVAYYIVSIIISKICNSN